MKKIIGVLVVLLFATGVFGQYNINRLSFVEYRSGRLATIEDKIRHHNNINDDFEWIDYIHFIKDNKLYLFSYEPVGEPVPYCSRNVYLYSRDITDINAPWKKASGSIINNCYSRTCFSDVDFFTYNKDRHFDSAGKIVETDDGFELTIEWDLFSTINGAEFMGRTKLKYRFVHNPYGRVEYLHERVYE